MNGERSVAGKRASVFGMPLALFHLKERACMHEATFELPLAPSLNTAYPQIIKRGHSGIFYVQRVTGEALKDFKHDAGTLLLAYRHPAWEKAIEIGYEVTVYMSGHYDLDNRLKALQDTMAEVLGFNDKIIVEIKAKRLIDRKHPRMVVRLYTID